MPSCANFLNKGKVRSIQGFTIEIDLIIDNIQGYLIICTFPKKISNLQFDCRASI